MSFQNFYHILHVSTQATAKEIKAAYRRLAKMWHPDRNQGSKASEEKFKEILHAYETLSDPTKKKLYDFKFKQELSKKEPPPPPPKPPEKPKWESAEAYKSRIDDLWKQYEFIHQEHQRNRQGQGFSKKQKYYYYNYQKVTEEEFKSQTHSGSKQSYTYTEPASENRQANYDTYHMNTSEWKDYERQAKIENLVYWLAGLFVYSLLFISFPSYVNFFTFLTLLLTLLGFAWKSFVRKSWEHLVIEIHPDRIIRRGLGFNTATIFYEDITAIQEKPKGLYIQRRESYRYVVMDERTKTPNSGDPQIFIPVSMQGFDKIKNFLLSLETNSI